MSDVTNIELERFQYLLDAWGANDSRWPEDKIDFMNDILRRSEQARDLLEEAQEMDLLLDQNTAPEPSSALLSSVLELSDKPVRGGLLGLLWPFQLVWKPAAGMAFALCLGVTLGIVNPDFGLPDSEDTEFETIVFDADLDLELDDDNS